MPKLAKVKETTINWKECGKKQYYSSGTKHVVSNIPVKRSLGKYFLQFRFALVFFVYS